MSVNSDLHNFLAGSLKTDYESSISLITELTTRGHDVNLVHPSEYYIKKSTPFVKKTLRLKINKLEIVAENIIPEGDLFFIVGLEETTKKGNDIKHYQWTFLNMLDHYFNSMVNNANSESKTEKHRLLELKDIPLIPTYLCSSENDLLNILDEKKNWLQNLFLVLKVKEFQLLTKIISSLIKNIFIKNYLVLLMRKELFF